MPENELQLKITLAKAGLERDAAAAATAIRRQLGDVEADIKLKADDKDVKNLERAISELADETLQTAQQAEFLQKAYNLSDREIDQVINKMRRLGDEADRTKGAAGGLQGAIAGLAAGAAFAAIDALAQALQAVVGATVALTGKSLELARSQAQVEAALGAVFPTQEAIAEQLEFVRDVANSVGGSFTELSKEYSKFAAAAGLAGVATEDLQNVFAESSRVAALFGASAADQNLILNALSQIASKGVVSMEELRQQLGERLPVAFKATADGLGITTAELNTLVESGDLTAQEFFPAFAKGLQGIQGEANATTVAIGQLSNNFDDGLRALGQGLQPLQNEVLGFVNEILLATGENFDGFGPIVDATEQLSTALSEAPEAVEAFGEVLGSIANAAVEQLAAIIEAVAAFTAEEGNVEQLAAQFTVLVDAIEGIGTVIQFLIGLASSILQLQSAAESLPVVGDNFDRLLKFPTPFTLFIEVLRGVAEVILLLKDVAIDATTGVLDSAARILPVLSPIVDRIQQILGLLRTDPQAVTPITDSVAVDLKTAATTLETTKLPAPKVDAPPTPDPPDLSPIEDKYKALTAALEVEQDNQIRTLVEAGKSREEIEAKEREFLQRRINLNQQKADELRAVDASALDDKGRAKLNDTLLALDQKLASDRLRLAEGNRKATEDAEKAKTKAAEDAAKDRETVVKNEDKAAQDAEKAAKDRADAEVKRQEEIKRAREEQIKAIEAEQKAQVALAKVAIDSAQVQLDGLERVSEALDRQAAQLDAQADLVQAVGDLQNTINEARADGLREIINDEEASDSKKKKAAQDLLALTEQQFAQEKSQLEQRQALELQAFDLSQQQAALTEQRAIQEQELAIRRLELQKLEIANEIELARLRGDTRAVEIGEAQLGLIDEQIAGQRDYIASLQESAALAAQLGEGQRQALVSQQEGQDIDLATQQKGQARSVDAEVSDISKSLDRRGDRLVDRAEGRQRRELFQAQQALPSLLESARPNPQLQALAGLGSISAPGAIDLSQFVAPVVQEIQALGGAVNALAASPRQLTVATPDPVADTSKILSDIARQASQGVNP